MLYNIVGHLSWHPHNLKKGEAVRFKIMEDSVSDNPDRLYHRPTSTSRNRELLNGVRDQLEPITEIEPIPEALWEQYNAAKEEFFGLEGVEASTSENLPSEAPTAEE